MSMCIIIIIFLIVLVAVVICIFLFGSVGDSCGLHCLFAVAGVGEDRRSTGAAA